MPVTKKGAQTEIGRKIEELAGKIPAPISWLIPDPKDPTNFIQPVGGLTKMMANKYVEGLKKRIISGRIPAYHGTTEERAKEIVEKGFRGFSPGTELKDAYQKAGIPWETRKQIPKKIRDIIEMDARGRNYELGQVSFAPTRNVAERWAGHGGEVTHETYKQISEWLTAKSKGMGVEDYLNYTGKPLTKYKQLGKPDVIKAEIPLSDRQKIFMQHHLRQIEQAIEEGYPPKEVMKSYLENYVDLKQPKDVLDQIKVLKVLSKREGR